MMDKYYKYTIFASILGAESVMLVLYLCFSFGSFVTTNEFWEGLLFMSLPAVTIGAVVGQYANINRLEGRVTVIVGCISMFLGLIGALLIGGGGVMLSVIKPSLFNSNSVVVTALLISLVLSGSLGGIILVKIIRNLRKKVK